MITLEGRDSYTGTTDFKNWSDAMLTAAKLILHSHDVATELGCLASTGIQDQLIPSPALYSSHSISDPVTRISFSTWSSH